MSASKAKSMRRPGSHNSICHISRRSSLFTPCQQGMLIACTGVYGEILHNGTRLLHLASRRRPWESHRRRIFVSHRLFSVGSYHYKDELIRRLSSKPFGVKGYQLQDLRIHRFPVEPVCSCAKFYFYGH